MTHNERSTMYVMTRYTIVAPHVRNDGSMSGYPAALRAELLRCGIDGWSEYETHGSWRGKREAGTTFEILRGVNDQWGCVEVFGAAARRVMPDQEAIQITVESGLVRVFEA